MAGLVEAFAANLGWSISPANVLVEGTHDVALIEHAAALYHTRHGAHPLGGELSVIAAGYGDEGGVGGINRRLISMRQAAAADPDAHGRQRFRFIGLYDHDKAGRAAIKTVSSADSTIRPFGEAFLPRPVMSLKGGVDPKALKERFDRDNSAHGDLDWEVEDLVSGDIFEAFEEEHPTAVLRHRSVGGRTHREITTDGKRNLVRFVREYASLEDLLEVIKLIRALRDYTHLRIDHIAL